MLQQTPHQPAQLMLLPPPTASPMSTRWFRGLQTQLLPAHQLLLVTGRSIVRYVQHHFLLCCIAIIDQHTECCLFSGTIELRLACLRPKLMVSGPTLLLPPWWQSCLQYLCSVLPAVFCSKLVQLHSLVLPPPATQSVNDDLHIGTHRVCVFVCSPKAPLITSSPV